MNSSAIATLTRFAVAVLVALAAGSVAVKIAIAFERDLNQSLVPVDVSRCR
jgi:hypothetical protein